MKKQLIFVILMVLLVSPDAHALLCNPMFGCSCNVSATPVQFNSISPLVGSAAAVGQATVDCTNVIDVAPAVSVKINQGLYGTFAARQMKDAAGDRLDYNLYTTSLHSSVWGDGTAGTVAQSISGGLLSLGHWRQSQTIYAQATPTISTKPGDYSDTVTIRIDW